MITNIILTHFFKILMNARKVLINVQQTLNVPIYQDCLNVSATLVTRNLQEIVLVNTVIKTHIVSRHCSNDTSSFIVVLNVSIIV